MRCVSRCCAGALLGLAVTGFATPPDARLLHEPAPEFVRADLQQRQIDLHAYRGHVVLLTFWATWCAPCQIEMPHFVAWQQQYGPQGLQILAISMDDDATSVERLMQRRHVNYPVVMGDLQLAKVYGGVLGLPVTYLIDRKGVIAARFKGESNLNAMQQTVAELLKQP